MSTPTRSSPLQEEILAEHSCASQVCTLTIREWVLGRVVISDHALHPGCDPFVSRCFELTETNELLDLTTATRVYEEIQIHRTRRVRSEVVGTTLRRERAEVTEASGPDATP